MRFGDGAHNVESEAGALNAAREWPRYTIKPLENLLELALRNACSFVLHTHGGVLLVSPFDLHGDIHVFSRILDGIIDQVRNSGAHLVEIAEDGNRLPWDVF